MDNYLVEKLESGSNYWMNVGVVPATQTSAVCQGLRSQTEYIFRVFAENEMGVGEPGFTIIPVRTKPRPGMLVQRL